MEEFNPPEAAILRQIADALGIPVERFLTLEPPSEGAEGMNECLNLWLKIRTSEGRRKALNGLRAIIESEN